MIFTIDVMMACLGDDQIIYSWISYTIFLAFRDKSPAKE